MLPKAIESILSQTFTDLELIIVNDGSTDNTEKVIKSFMDPRIKYLKNNCNKGFSYSANSGLKGANGNFILITGDDLVWLPHRLEKTLEIFKKCSQNIGVVYCTSWISIKNKLVKSTDFFGSKPKEGFIHKYILETGIVSFGSAMTRKECFEKCGDLDENLFRFLDKDLFTRISKVYEFKHLNEPQYINYSYESKEGISRNTNTLALALQKFLQKHYDDISQDKRIFAIYLNAIGYSFSRQGNTKEGRKYILMAIKNNPLNVQTWSIFALSIAGTEACLLVSKIRYQVKNYFLINR